MASFALLHGGAHGGWCWEEVVPFERLRPQGFTMFTEPCPLTAWPDIPATYILMTEDQSVSPDWSRTVAKGRLGAPLVELPGGHSPFYDCPDDLVAELDAIATRSTA